MKKMITSSIFLVEKKGNNLLGVHTENIQWNHLLSVDTVHICPREPHICPREPFNECSSCTCPK